MDKQYNNQRRRPAKKLARLLLCLSLSCLCLTAFTKNAGADEATERRVFQYLVENLNLNPAAACGVMGNIEAESKFNIGIRGLGGAFGLCQWAGVRISRLVSFCSSHGLSTTSVEGQLAFANYELQAYFPGVNSYIHSVSNTASGAYQAAYHWCMYFEAPANKYYASAYRGSLAQNIYWPKYGANALYLTASSAEDGIKLTWSGSSTHGYMVQRSDSLNGKYKTIAKLKKKTRTFVDEDIKKRKKYYYRICYMTDKGKAGSSSNRVGFAAVRMLGDSKCQVKLKENSYFYTGKAVKPGVKVTYGKTKLKEGMDYTVAYKDNSAVGKGIVIITGKGGYAGSVKKKFTIDAPWVEIKAGDIEKTFKPGRVLTPSVKISGTKEKQYTLKSNDTKVVSVAANGRDLIVRGIGQCKIKVMLKDASNYDITGKYFTVKICPKTPALKKAVIKDSDLKIAWDADTSVSGYEIQISDDSAFVLDGETFPVKGGKNTSVRLEDVIETEECFVRIRSYQLSGSKEKIYSSWSDAEPAM